MVHCSLFIVHCSLVNLLGLLALGLAALQLTDLPAGKYVGIIT